MSEILVILLLWCGGIFMLLAGVGLVRFPDVFMRMHAAAKAGTLGLAGLGSAVGMYFERLDVTCQALLIVVFLFMTASVAAHTVGKAAYAIGVPMWEKSVSDALAPQPAGEARDAAQIELKLP